MAGLLAVIAFLTIGAATSAAATLNVATTGADTGNCATDPCLTVQYAADQAVNGDTIKIGAGSFVGQTLINGKSVTISGAGDSTVLEAPTGTIPVLPGTTRRPILGAYGGADVTVETLKLDGAERATASANVVGFASLNASADINDITIVNVRMPHTSAGPPPQVASNQVGTGVYAFANSGDHSFRMNGSRVSGFQKNGISAGSQFLTVEITNNQVTCGGQQEAQQQNALVVGFGATGANPVKQATVSGNTIGACQYVGPSPDFRVGAGTLLWHNAAAGDVVFSGNTINGSDLGFYGEGSSPTSELEISGNDFNGAGSGNVDGAGINLVGGTVQIADNDIDGSGPYGNGHYGIAIGGSDPTVNITGSTIKNNQVGIATANPVPAGVTQSNNTFTGNGANASQRIPGVDVGTDLWVTTGGTDNDGNSCLVEANPCATVQRAVGQAVSGDTINVGPGTFGASGSATASVDKAGLTIKGVDAESTIIEAPEGTNGATAIEIGGAGDDLTLEDLKLTSPYETVAEGDLRGIRTAAGPVAVSGLTLNGVEISGLRYGIETPSVASAQQATLTDTTIRQSLFTDNEYSVWSGGDTTGFDVIDSAFVGNDFGIQSYPPDPNPSFEPGVFEDVDITGTMFAATAKKAIYLEAASNLLIDDVTVIETGTGTSVNPPAYKPPYDGIDINAKFGDFSDITISNTEASTTAVNPDRTLAVQGGISIKSRNDGPTYGAHPASISDVSIDNVVADENQNGLVLGGDLDDVAVTGSDFGDNTYAGISLVRETAGTGSTVTDLTVSGNSFTDGGAGIATNTGADQTTVTGLDVSQNKFIDNDAGISITPAGITGAGQTVGGNAFRGNAIGIQNQSASGLNAENNWWGCNNGPGGEGCDTTVGSVDSFPYIVFSAVAAPGSIRPGQTAQVTAGFNRNNSGQAVDGSVLDGATVNFAATNGSVNPGTRSLSGGNATTAFTPSGALGAAKVTATTGGIPADATIQVSGTAPTITAPALSGSGRVGEALTCVAGQAGGVPAPTVTTEFLADGNAIPGQSGLSYTPVAGDVGKSITCRSTAANSVGSVNASSQPVVVTAIPDPPKPPVIPPVKQNTKVPNSGKVVVTTITCPDGTCKVKAPKTVKVKIGGKTYTAKVKVQGKVGEGKSAKVTIVLPKNARKAIKGKTGKAKLKITVTSSDGKKKTLNQNIKLKGKKR